MKLSRRTNTIILWIVSIGLLVGMVITFTPTLGALTGRGGDTSAPALVVDGETITELDVAQARQASPIFTVVQEGPVAEDLDRLLVDSLIRQEVVRQEAARQRVGNGAVRDELEAFRERNGVAGRQNDDAYLRLIGGAGYTDATFRDYLRQQLQIRAWQEELTGDVEVTDAEVEAFYRVNQDAYTTDPRVLARQIVVDDRETAEAIRADVQDGASFAEIASERSLERAEQGGAVGGEEPQPVGRPAFPSSVGDAVFARTTPGLTPVVEAAGRFYVVQVEEIVPAEPRPLTEVEAEVREDALAAKQQAALDEAVERLVSEAEVTVPEGSELTIDDPVVATVGDREILASELARATYTNPQIQQALSPETASLIADFFKPSILEQLVDRELAVQGSSELDATFFGSDALIAQSALDWVARDAEVDAAEIQAYYQANLDRYTVGASADVVRYDFGSFDEAEAFRAALAAGATPEAAAEEIGGTAEDLGVVRPGALAASLDAALFETDAFEVLPGDEREVSDVLVLEVPVEDVPATDEAEDANAATDDAATDEAATDEAATDEAATDEAATDEAATEDGAGAETEPRTTTTYVVLVADRTDERVRPLEEVRTDVEAAVLAQERQALQREWLDGLREEIEVETTLAQDAALPTATDTVEGGDAAAGDEAGDPAAGDAAAGEGATSEEVAAGEDAASEDAGAATGTD